MMTYLIKQHNYTVDEAVAFGKKLTFTFRLGSLLDAEITMSLKQLTDIYNYYN